MTIELNDTGLAELDFATPPIDVRSEIIERHRELAKIMVSPGKALAIPVAEPLEHKLLREYKEELVLQRRRAEAEQWRDEMMRSIMRPMFSSYCSPSRYNMLIDHEQRTATFPRPAPQAFYSSGPTFDERSFGSLTIAAAIVAVMAVVAVVFVAGVALA